MPAQLPGALRKSPMTYRQYDHWCCQGLVSERLKKDVGAGYARRTHNRAEIQKLKFMAECVSKLTMTPRRAAQLWDNRVALIDLESNVVTIALEGIVLKVVLP